MNNWKENKISELGEIVSGATPSTSISEFWNEEYVWITPYDLSRLKTKFIETSERKISKLGLQNCSATLLPKGSIVLSSRAPIGYLAIVKKEFCTNQGCKSIRLKPEYDPVFQYYNIGFNIDKLKQLGEGTTFAEISKTDLASISIKSPNLPIQRKIARILSTIDAVIEKTQQAIEKYKAIKHGMMHYLFTRGIDPEIGKLRPPYSEVPQLYKETELGWVPKGWNVTSLINSTYIRGRIGWQGLKASEFIETGPFLITGTDFNDGEVSWDTCYHISEKRFKEDPNIHVRNDDVLITKDGSIGKVAFVSNCPSKSILNSGIFVLRCEDDSYFNRFLYYTLNSIYFKRFLGNYQGGSTINHLYQREFEKFQFPVPEKIEQSIIIEKLNAITNTIKVEQDSLIKHKNLKQGLMQDLLSGRVEVKV